MSLLTTIGPGNKDSQEDINSQIGEQLTPSSWSPLTVFQKLKTLATPVASFVAAPVKYVGKKAVDYTANYSAQRILGYFEIPYINDDVPARLANLDENLQLPILADTLCSIICDLASKKLNIPVDPNTQAALKPSIERILANLACYSPSSAKDEKGEFLSNICKNLYKILNPYDTIHAKLLASEKDDIISELIDDTKTSSHERQLLLQLKKEYSTYFEQESSSEGPDEEGFEDPEALSQRDWFIEIGVKTKREIDFDSISGEILKAAGVEGRVLGYLGGFLAPALKGLNEKYNPPSDFDSADFPGHDEVSQGITGLAQSGLPLVIESNKKEIMSLLINAVTDNEIHGVDPLWIEKFVNALCNPNEPELQKSLLVIGQYLASQFIQVLEYLASSRLHPETNLLESALLNAIQLFSRHFVGKEAQLQEAIVSYDKDGIQAEAYRAYVSKGFNKKDLTEKDVMAILEDWNEAKKKALIDSFEKEKQNANHLLPFFQFKKAKHAEEQLTITLRQAFEPLAEECVRETGIDQNAFLSLFVTKDKMTKGLLELYRLFDGPNNRTKGMGKVIQDFIQELSTQLKSAPVIDKKLYKNLLNTLTEGRDLSESILGTLANTLSDFNSSWLKAIHKALEAQTIVSEDFSEEA